MCDICQGESGGKDIGVAAVPAAPVSVMWCDKCLQANAVPRFVAETWLFAELEPPFPDDLEEKALKGLAGWALDMNIWLDGGYVSIRDALPKLIEAERNRDVDESVH